jgi:coproporphyrinogen III oxidase-like Fe-S oxidoreductase
VETAADYVARWQAGAPVESSRTASTPDERLMVGLRLAEGVRLTPEECARHGDALSRFANQGLLIRNGDMLRLTGQGVLYSNDILQEFLA